MARRTSSSYPSSGYNSGQIGGVYPALLEPARAEAIFGDLPQLFALSARNKSSGSSGLKFSEIKGEVDSPNFEFKQSTIPDKAEEEYQKALGKINKVKDEYENQTISMLIGVENSQMFNTLKSINFFENKQSFNTAYANLNNERAKVGEKWGAFLKNIETNEQGFKGDLVMGEDYMPVRTKEGNLQTHISYRDYQEQNWAPQLGLESLKTFMPTKYKEFNDLFESYLSDLSENDINIAIKYVNSSEGLPEVITNSQYAESVKDGVSYTQTVDRETLLKFVEDPKGYQVNPNEVQTNEDKIYLAYKDFITNVMNDPDMRLVYEKHRFKFFNSVLSNGKVAFINENGEIKSKEVDKRFLNWNTEDLIHARKDTWKVDRNGKEYSEAEQEELKRLSGEYYQQMESAFRANLLNAKKNKTLKFSANLTYEFDTGTTVKEATPEEETSTWLDAVFDETNWKDFKDDKYLSMWQDYDTHIGKYPDAMVLNSMMDQLGLWTMKINADGDIVGSDEEGTFIQNDFNDYIENIIDEENNGPIKDEKLISAMTALSGYQDMRGDNETLYHLFIDDKYQPTQYGMALKNLVVSYYQSEILSKYGASDKLYEFNKKNAADVYTKWKKLRIGSLSDSKSYLAKAKLGKEFIYDDDKKLLTRIEGDNLENLKVYQFDASEYEGMLDNVNKSGNIWARYRIFKPPTIAVQNTFNEMLKKPFAGAIVNFGGRRINLPTVVAGIYSGNNISSPVEIINVDGIAPMAPMQIENGSYKLIPTAFVMVGFKGNNVKTFEIPIKEKDDDKGYVKKSLSDLSKEELAEYGIVKEYLGENANEDALFQYQVPIQISINQLQSKMLQNKDVMKKFNGTYFKEEQSGYRPKELK